MSLWERRRSALILAGLVACHGLLIVIQVPQGASKTYFERAVFFVYAPAQRLVVGAVRGLASFWGGYVDLRAVRGENVELKRRNFFLAQDIRFLEDRLGQAGAQARLKESLAAFEGSLVAARVIGVDSLNPHQTIVIDKGTFDGVARDMAVCDRNGALVGRTIVPGLKETQVQLITDKDSSVSVRAEGTQMTGAMTGLSRDICEFRYILATAGGIAPGQEVRTTGYDRIYPPGLRVGVVEQVDRDPATPIFLKILVRPHFGFDTIDAVAVLTLGPGAAK